MWLDEFVLISQENGMRTVRADITADSKPSTMPTDGTDIDGLSANDTLDKGSTIYCIADGSLWMMQSDGTWVQQ